MDDITTISGTNVSRRQLWVERLDEHRAVLERMLVNLEREREIVNDLFRDVPAAADPDSDPASAAYGDAVQFLAEVHDIALVAAYHWVERELKALCEWTAMSRQAPADVSKKIRSGNFKDLTTAFAALGISLNTAHGFAVVDTMREFANSWKHNAGEVSAKLATSLDVPDAAGLVGHLVNSKILDGFARMLDQVSPVDSLLIVRLCLEQADRFLTAVIELAPT